MSDTKNNICYIQSRSVFVTYMHIIVVTEPHTRGLVKKIFKYIYINIYILVA